MKFNSTGARRLRELSFRLINNNPWMAFWISCDGWKVVEVKDHPPKKKGRPWKKNIYNPWKKGNHPTCTVSVFVCFHLHRQACQLQWLSDFVGKHWWKRTGKQNTPQRWNNMKQKTPSEKNSTSPKHHNQVVWSEDSEHLSILLNFKVLNLVEYLCTHRWAKTNCQISAFNVATMTLVRLLKRVSSWESIKLVAKLSVHQHAPELFVEWLCSEYLVFPSSSWVLQAPDKVGENNLWTSFFENPLNATTVVFDHVPWLFWFFVSSKALNTFNHRLSYQSQKHQQLTDLRHVLFLAWTFKSSLGCCDVRSSYYGFDSHLFKRRTIKCQIHSS